MADWYYLAAGKTFAVAAPPGSHALVRTAAKVLAEELQEAGLTASRARTRADLVVSLSVLTDDDQRRAFRAEYGLTLPLQPEAYGVAVRQRGRQTAVEIAGSDPAGVLYAVGRLLRSCDLVQSAGVAVPPGLNLTAHPWHPPLAGEPAMRGQQLTSDFCRQTVSDARLERYLRELALWGNNWLWVSMGANLAHAGSTAEAQAQAEQYAAVLNAVSAIAARYGMKFGLHVCGQRIEPTDVRPGMVRQGNLCPSVPAARKAVLQALDAAYARLKRLDAVFTASGDPGGCRCDDCRPWPTTYLAMAAEQAAVLRRHHPQARYYLSNQQMRAEENDLFLGLLVREQPDWLTGVLWGPQSRSLPEMRERIPQCYQVILYPDITHAAVCQHPVEGWEKERALFFERRSPTYRPLATRALWEATKRYADGSKPYSEGVYDDLNKAVWTGSQWCVTTPHATMPVAGPEPLGEIVHQYARRHFGRAAEELLSEVIFTLEENWSTPLVGNAMVLATLDALRSQEALLPADRRDSWRWQVLMIRAEMDRWLQLKVMTDREADARALRALAQPGEVIARVHAARRRLVVGHGGRELRALQAAIRARQGRIRELIGLDLKAPGRMDRNYANREWLLARLAEIEQASARRREALVRSVLGYEDPGPGGAYDDCGNVTAEQHLISGEDYMHDDFAAGHRLSCDVMSYGRSEWDADVVYAYTGLDPNTRYRLEVTCLTSGRMPSTQVLYASGIPVLGPFTLSQEGPERLCCDLPPAAYAAGNLELRFRRVEGRGPLVSEIRLVRVK